MCLRIVVDGEGEVVAGRGALMDLDVSEGAARRALRVIWAGVPAGELVEISARRGKKWSSVFCTVEEAVGGGADGVAAARGVSAAGSDVYVGAVSLSARPARGRGRSGLRSRAGCLWIDLDCVAPGRVGDRYFPSVEVAVREVDEVLEAVFGEGAASRVMVIGSGWGIQVWLPVGGGPGGYGPGLEGRHASALVRSLVKEIADRTGRHVDRIFDLTRVMRMPATWNYRAGRGEELGVPSGVLRWPMGAAWSVLELNRALPPIAVPEMLTARAGGRLAGTGLGVDGALLDLETLTDRVLTWSDVLLPAGWSRMESEEMGAELEVWSRPGRRGERSAVVYRDGGGVLTVYSDSDETGFGRGLRGAGARGEGAGVGVISRWRALVDLEYGGDRDRAVESMWSGGGSSACGEMVANALDREWELTGLLIGSWSELTEQAVWGPNHVGAQEELHRRAAAAVGIGLPEPKWDARAAMRQKWGAGV